MVIEYILYIAYLRKMSNLDVVKCMNFHYFKYFFVSCLAEKTKKFTQFFSLNLGTALKEIDLALYER